MFRVVIALCFIAAHAQGQAVTCSRVIDGDTFVTSTDQHVRLLGIDAPEIGQPGGKDAKAVLEVLILDRSVSLQESRKGAWLRTDAIISWRGRTINNVLVENGWAWPAPQYQLPSQRVTLDSLHAAAVIGRKGIWISDNPVAPWDWRNGIRPIPAGLPVFSDVATPFQPGCQFINGRLVCPSKR